MIENRITGEDQSSLVGKLCSLRSFYSIYFSSKVYRLGYTIDHMLSFFYWGGNFSAVCKNSVVNEYNLNSLDSFDSLETLTECGTVLPRVGQAIKVGQAMCTSFQMIAKVTLWHCLPFWDHAWVQGGWLTQHLQDHQKSQWKKKLYLFYECSLWIWKSQEFWDI